MNKIFIVMIFLCFVSSVYGLSLESIKLPPGFEISIYAEGVLNARSMALSPNGTLFVGTRNAGNVYAIIDKDKDYKADEIITIASGLRSPNGVAFKDGSLYVAEISRVLRYDNIEANLKNPPNPIVINDSFPTDEAHGWKFIRFGPDGMLYVPIGAPCNVCEREDKRYSTIMRMNPNGVGLEIFAYGIRNTVGFDWHPETKELWFTDNGRDWLGDDVPPDELNYAPKPNMHFGFPYFHGGDIPDPDFGKGRNQEDYTPPAIKLGPHVAALGMRFYTGTMFPSEYKNQIFIAEHGSWNRSIPIGYRVTLVRLNGDKAVSYEVFADGWLQGRTVLGRPVDVQVMPDGSLLVSDDFANAIYRIRYSGINQSIGYINKKTSLWGYIKQGQYIN
ncbi:MAG: PQQ-dependent sugar dehydrogenase [Candidatus Poribacteria bacterium]